MVYSYVYGAYAHLPPPFDRLAQESESRNSVNFSLRHCLRGCQATRMRVWSQSKTWTEYPTHARTDPFPAKIRAEKSTIVVYNSTCRNGASVYGLGFSSGHTCFIRKSGNREVTLSCRQYIFIFSFSRCDCICITT